MLGFAMRFSGPAQLGRYAGPSLELSFEGDTYAMGDIGSAPQNKAYSDLITFTRASGGGITNAAGQFQWVGNNVPRITYDPVTLKRLGQLIEEQRTNLLLQSADPTNAAWTKASATVGTSVTGPGGLNAQRLVEAAGAGLSPEISQFATVTSGATVVGIRFVKAGERSFARMQLASSGGAAYAASRFNLADGAKVAGDSDVALNSATNVKSGSVNYGSGWWMIWLSCTLPAGATTARLTTRIVADASSFGYTGDGVSAIYIGPAQLEEAGAFGSYIPTTTTQVTRAADVATVNTLSPWFNAAEGTLVAIFALSQPGVSPTNQHVCAFSDGGFNNYLAIRKQANTSIRGQSVVAGAVQADISSGASTASSMRVAFSYKANSFAISQDGSAVVTDSSGAIPAVDRLDVGRLSGAGQSLNGTISSITYYPRVINVQQASA